SMRRAEEGRIGLEELAGLAIPEAWFEQNEDQAEGFHLVQCFAIRHAAFVERNERQLQLHTYAVVEKLSRSVQNTALVALHVDLQEQSALFRSEVSPNVVEPALLDTLRRDIPSL